MDKYTITVTVPCGNEECDTKLMGFLKNKTYHHRFYNTVSSLDMRILTFENISNEIINIIKAWFMETYKNHPNAKSCTFQVRSYEPYQV